jgi:CMP-N,N'-diacetyllegionaminic acid synthase
MTPSKKKYRIIAIIPARGGSKRVPKKNIRMFNGKPLIAWTIKQAKDCRLIDRTIVSTDSEEISQIAKEHGAEIPCLRPKKFAADDTSDLPVYQHMLEWLQDHEGYIPDIIVWLRPTAPLRTERDIEGSIGLLIETKADWVRSVCLVDQHPYWMYTLNGNKLKPFMPEIDIRDYYRHQLLPSVYRINGAVDVTWRDVVMEKMLLYSGDMRAYIMPEERSIDIDTQLQFAIAELTLPMEKK